MRWCIGASIHQCINTLMCRCIVAWCISTSIYHTNVLMHRSSIRWCQSCPSHRPDWSSNLPKWHLKPWILHVRTWEMLYTSSTLSFSFYGSGWGLWVLRWFPWIYFLPFYAQMCPLARPRLTFQKSSHESMFARNFDMLQCVWCFG